MKANSIFDIRKIKINGEVLRFGMGLDLTESYLYLLDDCEVFDARDLFVVVDAYDMLSLKHLH